MESNLDRSNGGDVPDRGEGIEYGAGVKAEPARKPKELPRVSNSDIIKLNHNV